MKTERITTNYQQTFQHSSSNYYVLTKRYADINKIKKVISNFSEPWYKKTFYYIKDSFINRFKGK